MASSANNSQSPLLAQDQRPSATDLHDPSLIASVDVDAVDDVDAANLSDLVDPPLAVSSTVPLTDDPSIAGLFR
jgi:hypothetical protein